MPRLFLVKLNCNKDLISWKASFKHAKVSASHWSMIASGSSKKNGTWPNYISLKNQKPSSPEVTCPISTCTFAVCGFHRGKKSPMPGRKHPGMGGNLLLNMYLAVEQTRNSWIWCWHWHTPKPQNASQIWPSTIIDPGTEDDGRGRVVFNDWDCDFPPTISCNDLEILDMLGTRSRRHKSMCIICQHG